MKKKHPMDIPPTSCGPSSSNPEKERPMRIAKLRQAYEETLRPLMQTINNWDNGKANGNYYGILGLYWDNGKANGDYDNILGLYWDNGKENGNYYP